VGLLNINIAIVSPKALLLFALLFSTPTIFGGIPNDSTTSKDIFVTFMDYVYDFSFYKADSVLRFVERNKDNSATFSMMKYNLAWWSILSGSNTDDFIEECDLHTDKTIDFINRLESPDINYQIDLINTYILKVRLENYINNKVNTIPILFKTLNRIKKLMNTVDLSDRKLLVIGLYYYFVDYVENKYILAGAFLKKYPKGNKQMGLNYLKKCLSSMNHLVAVEANYFLYKIYFYIEGNYQLAFDNISYLHDLYPNNLVFSYELYKTMMKNNNAGSELLKQEVLNQIYDSKLLKKSQKTHFIDLFNENI